MKQQIKQIIFRQGVIGRPDGHILKTEHDIKVEHDLHDGLMLDSLDIIEITMALEEEFERLIPDDNMTQWQTVQDIIDYMAKETNNASQ